MKKIVASFIPAFWFAMFLLLKSKSSFDIIPIVILGSGGLIWAKTNFGDIMNTPPIMRDNQDWVVFQSIISLVLFVIASVIVLIESGVSGIFLFVIGIIASIVASFTIIGNIVIFLYVVIPSILIGNRR